MKTAVQHFLGKLERTLSPGAPAHPQMFALTKVEEPFVGKQLGDCRILSRVGQGSMSVLYKAQQDVTERTVAVKMLRVQLCCDPRNIKRFEREARAISRLQHLNLPSVYHVARARTGQPYIVMDYVEGKSLEQIVKEDGPIAWDRLLGIISQVCDAMQHAHDQNIIHRDLKPDNIMILTKTGAADLVKVVDFGIVKLTDESQRLSQRLTQTNEVWGSPIYMSPEQIQGSELDARSDIYSLGAVMYECLTGQVPFNGRNITELVMKQLANDPEPLGQVNPAAKIPEWLEKVVLKAMQKEPAKRFRSMADFKAALVSPQQRALQAASAGKSSKADRFIGQTLEGGYNIVSFIGEGGMSIVYKAVQEGTERVVAVKVMRPELCTDEAYMKRFEREAKSLGRLSHPGLLSIYDFGKAHTGQPYMVIEFLDGRSLQQWVLDHGKMNVKEALPIFIQVCETMAYAHKQGIIHRDIKPHNIMLVKQGNQDNIVKVVDFGIVKLDENIVSVSQKLTASGEICGSPMYMSPEQILDQPLDARTDIYSFGIVMYELLSGRPLFGGNKITEVMNKHVNIKPQPLPAVVQDNLVPARLDVAIRRCLEKGRDSRFDCMDDLKEELVDIQAHLEPLLEEAARLRADPSLAPAAAPPVAVPSDAKPAAKPPSLAGIPAVKSSVGGRDFGRIALIIAGICMIAAAVALAGMRFAQKEETQIETEHAPVHHKLQKPRDSKHDQHRRGK